jgi:leucyl aminopeptidase (aminopeptidase T)
MADLETAVATVVGRCLAVKPGENVLVIVDDRTVELGHSLRRAALDAGADATLVVITERESHGAEPPAPVAAAMAAADVFIAPTTKSLSHTQARKAANEAGARGATLPGVTADMLGRLMSVDYDKLSRRCRAVAALLDAADEAYMFCPRGSDITFDLSGRPGLPDDGLLVEPGAFGNLPCGEGYIAPVSGAGPLWVATTPADGVLLEPALLTVENGRLEAATPGPGERFLAHLLQYGKEGTNLAELGVGTNPKAILTGNVLEDEKILGTVHVAFGASAAIGGTVSVPIHEDVVVLAPTLEIGGTRVLDEGRWVLAA